MSITPASASSNNLLELRNLVQVASLSYAARCYVGESRGLHYTLDYPQPLPEQRPVDTVAPWLT
ncbi:hypothetical protein LNP25_32430 [Klebsiella variicola subsp. variicola]|nr:hypothetical protein [Klebsiella variicola subsp. variicola]